LVQITVYIIINCNLGWTNSTGFSASTKDPKPFGPSGSRFNGHNYTVSINFNRPQQSKGTRPIRGKIIYLIIREQSKS